MTVIALLFLALLLTATSTAEAREGYELESVWFSGETQFNRPTGIAVDVWGYIYVVDSSNNRIQIFDGSGVLLTMWGRQGSEEGELNGPMGVAVDASGNVYVTDANRVQKFTRGGDLVASWGGMGAGDGEFNGPWGVAVDPFGYVYVADTWNHRVQKFGGNATLLMSWGSQGSGERWLHGPTGLAVDPDGNVFVADSKNDRIQKFDASGRFLEEWGVSGKGEGELDAPWGISVDPAGNVYVADSSHVQKFTAKGVFLTNYVMGDGEGSARPAGVAVDSTGFVYATDHQNNCVYKFDGQGAPVAVWRDDDGEALFQCPWGVVVDASGNVFVTDYFANSILKLDPEGDRMAVFGRHGPDGVELNGPVGIALDDTGCIYVTDYRNNRVQKLDSNGGVVAMWGHYGYDGGQFRSPTGIAVDPAGHVYVGDYLNNRIQKFGPDITPPYLLGISPADGEEDVDPASSIDLMFGEAMDTASVEGAFVVRTADGQEVKGDIVWSEGSTMCTFTPSTRLEHNVTYVVHLLEGATDAAGNAMVPVTETMFRTAAGNATTIMVMGSQLAESLYNAVTPKVNIAGSILGSSEVVNVTWSNDRGGSGVATGTSEWSIPEVKLSSGVNNITIFVQYASGRTNSQAISVVYHPSEGSAQSGFSVTSAEALLGLGAAVVAGAGGLYLWRRRRRDIE